MTSRPGSWNAWRGSAGEGQGGFALPRLGVTAPAGYSFYVFSAASYLIDAFARRLPLAAGAGEVALYLAWFPKILAGPIERAPGFLDRVRLRPAPRRSNWCWARN